MNPTLMKRILVPVEGGTIDDEAFGLACQIAKKNKGEIYLLYVIQVQRQLALGAEQTSEMEKGEQCCERLLRAGEHAGCRVQVEILQARSAGVAIVGEAINRKADLIVMGVALEKKFGETEITERDVHVLKHAPCRVWLVRDPLLNGADTQE